MGVFFSNDLHWDIVLGGGGARDTRRAACGYLCAVVAGLSFGGRWGGRLILGLTFFFFAGVCNLVVEQGNLGDVGNRQDLHGVKHHLVNA